jgi:type III restriction enzyme
VKGDYARIFEEEYAARPSCPLTRACSAKWTWPVPPRKCTTATSPSTRKAAGRTPSDKDTAGNRENAERAYNLIMKEKEKLLSFDTPLKFIFSHSALKEGWDNPNVFQICALRDMGRPSASAARPSAGACACA